MRANLVPAVVIGYLTFILFVRSYIRCAAVVMRVSLIAAGFILATPAVLFAGNYLLLIPCASWFCEIHAARGAEITSGLIGAIVGIMFASSKLRPGRLNTPILVACTGFALVLLITPFAKQFVYALDYSSLKDDWKDQVCLQTSSSTCVPSSIATLSRLQGGHLTERELAQSAGATRKGTEIWYLTRALRARGYELNIQLCSIRKARVPCMIGVRLGDIGHAVVLLERHGNQIVIGDPMKGRHTYEISTFEKCYRPGSMCTTIRKLQ